MTENAAEPVEPAESHPATSLGLRIWIPILLLIAMPISRMIPRSLDDIPEQLMFAAAVGPAAMGILIMLWWITVSRAGWGERIIGLVGVAIALGVAFFAADISMQSIPTVAMITLPYGLAAFGIGTILANRLPFKRAIIGVLLAAAAFGYTALVRTAGMWGDFDYQLIWRWEPTDEEKMLAAKSDSPEATVSPEQITEWIANPQWPEFRGADRSGRFQGPAIDTDWKANPPKLLWKIPVGPAWSSFAIAGELLFTQEQRGPMEAVVCYSAESGKEIWKQEIESRFEESMGGPGPRATPTIAGGAVYAHGANGQVLRLDPSTGDVVWQIDIRDVAGREPPEWGFASSPLVTESVVIVHAGGEGNKGTLAFDLETGELKWSAASGDHSYSSAGLHQIGGKATVLMLTNKDLTLLDPKTGETRLTHQWEHNGYRSLQPHVVNGNSILLPSGLGSGTRRIVVNETDEGWQAEEQWTSRFLKPDFNDLVVYDGHIYGFDRSIFTCVDLETGDKVWKRGRYGAGQVLLLEKSGVLLVMSEKGDAVLLNATPEGHQEIAKFPAIEGKTWNHPVVVGNRLYLRNAQEAACYRLQTAGESETSEQEDASS